MPWPLNANVRVWPLSALRWCIFENINDILPLAVVWWCLVVLLHQMPGSTPIFPTSPTSALTASRSPLRLHLARPPVAAWWCLVVLPHLLHLSLSPPLTLAPWPPALACHLAAFFPFHLPTPTSSTHSLWWCQADFGFGTARALVDYILAALALSAVENAAAIRHRWAPASR